MKLSYNMKMTLIIIGVLLLYALAVVLFPLPSRASEDSQPQIVLVYEGLHPDGKTRIFSPKDKISIGLTPLGDYAPLSPESLSICKLEVAPVGVRFYDGREAGGMNEIMFHCGQDKYLFNILVTRKTK